MYERVVEIILFLANELQVNKRLNDVDVSSLTHDGYTQSEISSAFSWLFERMSVGYMLRDSSGSTSTSYRMLNDREKMIIESQAYGYLIQCQQFGIINNVDMETIIERIMAADFASVGLPEIKSVVASYLFDVEKINEQISLSVNDTIH